MAVVVWNKLFEYGIPIIDQQHKKIVTMMNNVVEKLEVEKISDDIKRECQIAIIIVAEHFSDEERLLEDIGYPGLSQQKELHKKIMLKLQNVRREIDLENDVLSQGIVGEFREMFKRHILEEDRKYGYYYHKGIMPSSY